MIHCKHALDWPLNMSKVSVIYRLRRRKRARCNGPPSHRSRPNLCQRAERFVRSSLSSSTGEASSTGAIDTPSLCERKASLSGAKMNQKSNTMTTNGRVIVHSSSVTTNESAGNLLSTFTGANEKYLPASEVSSSSAGCTDIRPIHTRLQKPTYLKSVISSSPPECLLNQSKKSLNKYSDSSCYLNINKQRHTASGTIATSSAALARHFGGSHSSELAKGNSFKKLSGSCEHGASVNARASYKKMPVIHSSAEDNEQPVAKQQQLSRTVASRKSVITAIPSRLYDASRSTEFVDRL